MISQVTLKDKFFNLAFGLLLLIGLSLSAPAQSMTSGTDVEPSRPFVMVYYLAEVSPDGKEEIFSWRTRYVKANGEFKVVMHGLDKAAAFAYDTTGAAGTSSSVLAGTAEGVYFKPNASAERKSLGPSYAQKPGEVSVPEQIHQRFHSHSMLRDSPEFVRMDKYLGLDVYVLRTEVKGPDGYWVEASHSPLTGRFWLQLVMHHPDGTEDIIKTVRIDFVDVPEDLNEDIKALPNTGAMGDKPAPGKKPN
jgi:hypothetical protein